MSDNLDLCKDNSVCCDDNCQECAKRIYSAYMKIKRKLEETEPKRGRWIWDNRFHDYTCSECNNWDLKTPNFCSNCGADMREVDDG